MMRAQQAQSNASLAFTGLPNSQALFDAVNDEKLQFTVKTQERPSKADTELRFGRLVSTRRQLHIESGEIHTSDLLHGEQGELRKLSDLDQVATAL